MSSHFSFRGVATALVTPMLPGGDIDEPALRRLVDYQISNGVHAVVPCGTTGESATLNHAEHHHVMDVVVSQTAGRVPVIIGAGSNATREAISLTQHARAIGASAVLSIAQFGSTRSINAGAAAAIAMHAWIRRHAFGQRP